MTRNLSVSRLRAITYALIGYTSWVMADSSLKFTAEMHLPLYEIIGFLGLNGVVVLFIITWQRGEIKKLWPRRPRQQAGRAVLALGTNFCNVAAFKFLSLASFYAIVFTTPMIVALLAAIFLRERLSLTAMVAIFIGFCGVLIAINPTGMQFVSGGWMGSGLTMLGVLIFALNVLWLRIMSQTESVQSMVLSSHLAAAVVGLVPMLIHFEPISLGTFGVLFAAGFFNVIGNLSIFSALKYAPATTISQFHYSQIIAGTVVGFFIWHDIPKLHTLTGAGIIIACGIYMATQARKGDTLTSVPT